MPPECIGCHAPVAEDGEPLVCAVCRLRWRALPDPVCETCGEPTDLGLACRLCVHWPPGFDRARSAVRLTPDVRELVHAFKYEGWHRLAHSFALRMAPLLEGVVDADLVPIPLASRRLRTRGYNQAERLAAALGAVSGLEVREDRLRRTRETTTQTRLTPEARAANLSGAFEATDSRRVAILVDDVFTTGATLTSAATALLHGDADRVIAVTFARAAPPLSDAMARLETVFPFRPSEETG